MIVAPFAGDSRTVARVLLRMGTPTQRVKLAEFKADIEQIRAKYLTAGSLGEADTAGFIEAFSALAARHRIRLPATWRCSPRPRRRSRASCARCTPNRPGRAGAAPARRHRPASPVAAAAARRDARRRRRHRLDAAHRAGQVDQLLHDFESGHLQLRALTPVLDELPHRCTRWAGSWRSRPLPTSRDRGGGAGAAGRRFDAGAWPPRCWRWCRRSAGCAAGLALARPRPAAEARPAGAVVSALTAAPRGGGAQALVPRSAAPLRRRGVAPAPKGPGEGAGIGVVEHRGDLAHVQRRVREHLARDLVPAFVDQFAEADAVGLEPPRQRRTVHREQRRQLVRPRLPGEQRRSAARCAPVPGSPPRGAPRWRRSPSSAAAQRRVGLGHRALQPLAEKRMAYSSASKRSVVRKKAERLQWAGPRWAKRTSIGRPVGAAQLAQDVEHHGQRAVAHLVHGLDPGW